LLAQLHPAARFVGAIAVNRFAARACHIGNRRRGQNNQKET